MNKEIERAKIRLEKAKKNFDDAQSKEAWKDWFKIKTWFFILLLLVAEAILGGIIAGIWGIEIFSMWVLQFLWTLSIIMFFISLIFGKVIIEYFEKRKKIKK